MDGNSVSCLILKSNGFKNSNMTNSKIKKFMLIKNMKLSLTKQLVYGSNSKVNKIDCNRRM